MHLPVVGSRVCKDWVKELICTSGFWVAQVNISCGQERGHQAVERCRLVGAGALATRAALWVR